MNTDPKPENPPAFPGSYNVSGYGNVTPRTLSDGTVLWQEMSHGMDLRDYLAAKALPVVKDGCCQIGSTYVPTEYYPALAKEAYALADAMLAERAKN